MGRILSRSLRFLDGIFNLQGSDVTTAQVDLAGVQLVLDVGSVVAAGRGPGQFLGHFQIDMRLEVEAESAVNRQFVAFGPDTQFLVQGAAFPTHMPRDFQFWIDRAVVKATWPGGTEAWADLTSRIFISHPAGYPGYNVPDSGVAEVLADTDDVLGAFAGATDGKPTNPTTDGSRIFLVDLPQPVFLPQDSILQLRVQNESATETVRVQANFQCRAVPGGLPAR